MTSRYIGFQDKVLKLGRHVRLVRLQKFGAAILKIFFRSNFMGEISEKNPIWPPRETVFDP